MSVKEWLGEALLFAIDTVKSGSGYDTWIKMHNDLVQQFNQLCERVDELQIDMMMKDEELFELGRDHYRQTQIIEVLTEFKNDAFMNQNLNKIIQNVQIVNEKLNTIDEITQYDTVN